MSNAKEVAGPVERIVRREGEAYHFSHETVNKDVPVIFPTHHDWIRRDYGLPGAGLRVLTYSPEYKGIDNCMLYRMMDASFVRISTDVTHWKVPSVPDGI